MIYYKTSQNKIFAFEDNINSELLNEKINQFGLTQITETEKNTILNANMPSAFDKAMADLRANRNQLLAETDYIVTKNLEAGTDIPAEWKTYRQSLRDLTNGLTTVEQVNAVVYPTKPE